MALHRPSEIVRDQEAVFLEDYEPKVRVLDPGPTDPFAQQREEPACVDALIVVPVRELLTPCDLGFDFFAEGIARLKETYELKARVDATAQDPRPELLLSGGG